MKTILIVNYRCVASNIIIPSSDTLKNYHSAYSVVIYKKNRGGIKSTSHLQLISALLSAEGAQLLRILLQPYRDLGNQLLQSFSALHSLKTTTTITWQITFCTFHTF